MNLAKSKKVFIGLANYKLDCKSKADLLSYQTNTKIVFYINCIYIVTVFSSLQVVNILLF